MELCAVGQLTINYKVISIFKNDFWKNILTDDIISNIQSNKNITITNEDKEIDEIEKIIDDELNDFKVSKEKQ